jgi:hypothetical protein
MKAWYLFLICSLAGVACRGGAGRAQDAAVATSTAGGLIEDEHERETYVEKNLEITGFDIGPDTKPDEDGGVKHVGGLLRVSGLVTNKGDRAVRTARIGVHIQDANGNVIGSYFNDIAGDKKLAPGESRPFKFQIPEKKEYGGKFTFSLR